MTGHVQALGRGRYKLVANLAAKMVDGKTTYPRAVKVVTASGSRAASEALAAFLVDVKTRQDGAWALTMEELLVGWLSEAQGYVRPRTLHFYSDYVERHLLPALGPLDVMDVVPSTLSRLYASKRATGLGETSCNHMHRVLKSAFTWAIDDGVVEDNPCQRLKRPPRPAYRKHRTWTDIQIAQAARDARGKMLEVPVLLAGFAGLRRGEVCALRWCDVDLAHGVMQVRQTMEQVRGSVHVTLPKTEMSRRVLPLVGPVRDALARQTSVGEYVVHTRDGRPVKPDNLSGAWKRFASRYEDPITFHELRHSFATNLIFGQGVDIKLVQELLGHSDPATTARIYLHPSEVFKADVIAAMDERISTQAARISTHRDAASRHEEVKSLHEPA
jgi:integrase